MKCDLFQKDYIFYCFDQLVSCFSDSILCDIKIHLRSSRSFENQLISTDVLLAMQFCIGSLSCLAPFLIRIQVIFVTGSHNETVGVIRPVVLLCLTI